MSRYSGDSGDSGDSGGSGHSRDSGYSGTPLARKVGIKGGERVGLRHAPEGWGIPGLPQGCEVVDGGPDGVDVALAFYRERGELAAEAAGLVAELADDSMLWIAWPRKAAGHVSDIGENDLREIFLPLGVVDVKVAALGDDWSGLKFVRRRENRRKG
ncbi:DUF3052 family protein [Streptomyces sp. S.PB5]|uniref:DUF3052 family protein n=1 Tax=Streptomyces sp. S.PB5 TaxID=3020844 RepID=UPI0025B0B546|nr:DUF3052 family protein [Streptomyces sp. S.PB5]MDN3026315.1 DUF3052 family protein [Streptomyces sp. S.PB5]